LVIVQFRASWITTPAPYTGIDPSVWLSSGAKIGYSIPTFGLAIVSILR
jgi:hypothetical protein